MYVYLSPDRCTHLLTSVHVHRQMCVCVCVSQDKFIVLYMCFVSPHTCVCVPRYVYMCVCDKYVCILDVCTFVWQMYSVSLAHVQYVCLGHLHTQSSLRLQCMSFYPL